MKKLLVAAVLAATLGCGQQSAGPLVGGTRARTTTGTVLSIGQSVTWGDTTVLVNPTQSPITLKWIRLLPSGDTSGTVEENTMILPAGNGPNFSVPGLVVGSKSEWYGRSVEPVAGYVVEPTPATHDGDSILFVVRAVRKGKWTYRGFEVAYTAGKASYVADYTNNKLLLCVAVFCQ